MQDPITPPTGPHTGVVEHHLERRKATLGLIRADQMSLNDPVELGEETGADYDTLEPVTSRWR
jgi:hypothetical protein